MIKEVQIKYYTHYPRSTEKSKFEKKNDKGHPNQIHLYGSLKF